MLKTDAYSDTATTSTEPRFRRPGQRHSPPFCRLSSQPTDKGGAVLDVGGVCSLFVLMGIETLGEALFGRLARHRALHMGAARRHEARAGVRLRRRDGPTDARMDAGAGLPNSEAGEPPEMPAKWLSPGRSDIQRAERPKRSSPGSVPILSLKNLEDSQTHVCQAWSRSSAG
jgi:hypothetical protein